MLRGYHPSVAVASIVTVLTASAWGVLWIPIRYFESSGISGVWTLALINLPAFFALCPVIFWTWHRQRAHLKPALLIGFTTGLGLALYGLGIVHTSVIRATLLFYLTPVWATLIGIYLLGETAGWQRWLAIGLGLIGLSALVGGGQDAALTIGDLLALLSGIVWAIGASMISRQGAIPVTGMVAFQFLCIALCVVAIGTVIAPLPLPPFEAVAEVADTLILIALLGMIPGVGLLFWAQQFLFPGRVGLLMMSEVVVAVISATLLLPEERMTMLQWAGAILIIAAGVVELIPLRRAAGQTAGR